MASATKQAIDALRDEDDGIVRFKNDMSRVYVRFSQSAEIEADNLIRDGWLIQPSSARENNLTIFKTLYR